MLTRSDERMGWGWTSRDLVASTEAIGQEAMVLLQHQRRRRLQEEAAARRQMFDGKEFTPIS